MRHVALTRVVFPGLLAAEGGVPAQGQVPADGQAVRAGHGVAHRRSLPDGMGGGRSARGQGWHGVCFKRNLVNALQPA